MRYLKWGLGLLLLLLIGGYWFARPTLLVGTGYAAKMACSCHYLQNRSLDDIHAADLNFSALKMMSLELREAEKQVEASLFGIVSQVAQYIPGRGCVLLANADQAAPVDLPEISATANALPTYDTLPAGLNLAALKTAVDQAFEPVAGGGTRGIVVLHNGKLVHEQYADGFDANTPLLGWSMTKSWTNALIGIMVKNGELSLEQVHLFPEWENDERAEIRLADLLHMNSGLDWNEAYGGASDATRMLYTQADMADYTMDKALAYDPDTHWVYSSGTTNLLTELIRQTFNDDEAYWQFARDSLFAPAGMQSARIEVDQSGNFVGSSYGWATAQDWARFGQLYLNAGRVGDRQILPEDWVSVSTVPAAGSNGIYGAQIWLPDPAELPDVPKDLFLFRGFQDQRIAVVPSRNCVIVRLGMNEDHKFPLNRFLTDVLAALPPAG